MRPLLLLLTLLVTLGLGGSAFADAPPLIVRVPGGFVSFTRGGTDPLIVTSVVHGHSFTMLQTTVASPDLQSSSYLKQGVGKFRTAGRAVVLERTMQSVLILHCPSEPCIAPPVVQIPPRVREIYAGYAGHHMRRMTLGDAEDDQSSSVALAALTSHEVAWFGHRRSTDGCQGAQIAKVGRPATATQLFPVSSCPGAIRLAGRWLAWTAPGTNGTTMIRLRNRRSGRTVAFRVLRRDGGLHLSPTGRVTVTGDLCHTALCPGDGIGTVITGPGARHPRQRDQGQH